MTTKQTTKAGNTAALGNSIRSVEPKTIAAVVLVALMGVLWARVLLKSGPDTALANSSTAAVDLAQQEEKAVSDIQIRPVILTEIDGRHDVIAADFFRADRCSAWNQEQESAASSTKPSDNQRMVNELIKAIALEAIIKDTQGKAEQACINGTLVTAGSILQVPVRNEMQSVRVMTVQPGLVRLNWQDRSIDIEMPDQKVN